MRCDPIAATVFSLVLVLTTGSAVAQTSAPSLAQRFLTARAQGVTAANAGDLETAASKLAEAEALAPNHPGVIQLRARVAMAANDMDGAIGHWRRYADLGLIADPAANPVYQPLTAAPGFAEVADRLTDNRRPIGAVHTVARLDRPLLAENVVRDRARDRLLVSAIRGRTILSVAVDGEISPYLIAEAPVAGVFGLALDEDRGLLWATTSGLAMAGPLPEGLADRSELLKIDLASGRLLARVAQPDDEKRSFGDLTVGPDGAVYVSDSIGGVVYRLAPGEDRLTVLVPAGVLRSPQGLALTPDSKGLFVADYTTGLYRIDLLDGSAARMAAPADTSLIGIDGVARRRNDLIVIQNGTAPQRVLRLSLTTGSDGIAAAETLAANSPELDEPTSGSVDGDALVFIATGQMSAYGEDGAERRAPPPVIIGRIDLP